MIYSLEGGDGLDSRAVPHQAPVDNTPGLATISSDESSPVSQAAATASPVAPSAAELRKVLRGKMTAVLHARVKLSQAQDAKGRTDANFYQSYKEFQALPFPVTLVEDQVRQYLSQSEERYRHYITAREAAAEANVPFNEATQEWHQSLQELYEAVNQAAVVELLGQDDVYQAAQQMTYLAPPSAAPDPVRLDCAQDPVDLSPEQLALVDALQKITAQTAVLTARARVVAPSVVAGAALVESLARPKVKDPVRPTEEEIQRYLRQLESATANRQRAHQAMPALLQQRQTLLKELAEAYSQLEAAQTAVKEAIADHLYHRQSGPVLASSQTVYSVCHQAQFQFGEDLDQSTLDKVQRPTPSKRETVRIQEVRQLMRQVALAKARHNEATVALNTTNISKEAVVHYYGIGSCNSWEDCQLWLEEKDKQQAEAALKNKSRKTKIELQAESVKQYELDIKTTTTELHRYLVALTQPGTGRPPCDELRYLINAASWMTHPPRRIYDESPRREGEYPIY